jgi:inosine-uridine nucleoside N-ribohydrolase
VPVEHGYSNAAYLLDALDKKISLHAGLPHTFTPERSDQRRMLSQRDDLEQIATMCDPAEPKLSAPEFMFRGGIPQQMIPLDVCHQTRIGQKEPMRIG